MSFGPHLLLALLEGTVTACVLAVTALGLSLVFGVMRIVNVAHGEFYMLGAVLAWFCASMVEGSPLVGFLLALLVAPIVVGALALAMDWAVLRRVKYHPESTIVATIGLLYILQQAVLSGYGPDARPVEAPIYFRVAFPWFGYSGYKLIVIGASVALLLGVWAAVAKSKAGLYMRGDSAGRRDGAGPRGAGAPCLRPGVRGRRHARGGGRGADRPDPAGPLPHGARPRCCSPSSS